MSTFTGGWSVRQPPVLIVPGWTNSGPQHWQTLWEHEHPEYRRVEQPIGRRQSVPTGSRPSTRRFERHRHHRFWLPTVSAASRSRTGPPNMDTAARAASWLRWSWRPLTSRLRQHGMLFMAFDRCRSAAPVLRASWSRAGPIRPCRSSARPNWRWLEAVPWWMPATRAT